MDERDIQYHLHFRQKEFQDQGKKERLISQVINAMKERKRKPKLQRPTI